jgi:hypothetical protein
MPHQSRNILMSAAAARGRGSEILSDDSKGLREMSLAWPSPAIPMCSRDQCRHSLAIENCRKELDLSWFQSWFRSPRRGYGWGSETRGARLQKRPKARWSSAVPHRMSDAMSRRATKLHRNALRGLPLHLLNQFSVATVPYCDPIQGCVAAFALKMPLKLLRY